MNNIFNTSDLGNNIKEGLYDKYLYKDGKKWEGVGKEFYQIPDKLLFEGEYKEGKRWNGIYFNI